MYRVLIIGTFILLVTACLFAVVLLPQIEVGDVVQIKFDTLANPRGWSTSSYWLLQQPDNCVLEAGPAQVLDVGEGALWVKQPDCTAWIQVTKLSR